MGSAKQKPPLTPGRCSICCKPTFNYSYSIAGVAVVNHLFPETCRRPTPERAHSRVVGSVQLKNGQRAASIDSSRINGDLQFESNAARIVARDNTIGANPQAVQNTGGLNLTSNRIAENLQCKENVPPPTGGGNTAGDKEDQCATL